MKKVVVGIMVAQVAVVALLVFALLKGSMPLGVPDEWEWMRIPSRPPWFGVLFAVTGVAGYSAIVGFGLRDLTRNAAVRREGVWLISLFVAALAVQVVVPYGAPDEYDLTRWAYVPFYSGSTGYYTVAKKEIRDPWRFLADYPDWIRRQDSLHIGTHPPGLLMMEHVLLRALEGRPATARFVLEHLPGAVRDGFQALRRLEPVPETDGAALALTSVLTWFACAATVFPLYLLARSSLPASAAWAAAALWPLAPSAILFQPVADAAFPCFSASAIALAAWAGRSPGAKGLALAVGAGVVLAMGMAFTLAFLPVGLVVALVLAIAPGAKPRRRADLIAMTGAGFLAPVVLGWWIARSNPFTIWWWNLHNHARFYGEFPRSYRSWILVNPVEFALGIGAPSALWIGCGLLLARPAPKAAWATLAVLAILNFSGRNLSEVARLWLPLMPPMLTAAGAGLTRFGGPITLALTAALLGAEVLALQATIQVVYPIVGGR